MRYHVKAPFEKPIRLLTSVPGIGVTTAVTLMVELDDIVCFRNADHLASFIGLVPMCHSSGESNGSAPFWWKLRGLQSVRIQQ